MVNRSSRAFASKKPGANTGPVQEDAPNTINRPSPLSSIRHDHATSLRSGSDRYAMTPSRLQPLTEAVRCTIEICQSQERVSSRRWGRSMAVPSGRAQPQMDAPLRIFLAAVREGTSWRTASPKQWLRRVFVRCKRTYATSQDMAKISVFRRRMSRALKRWGAPTGNPTARVSRDASLTRGDRPAEAGGLTERR